MKTFVILSDSHYHPALVEKLKPLFDENHFIVHLGDGSTDMRPIFAEYPEKTYVMNGNCDFTYGLPDCKIEAEKVTLFCCHGHKYNVKFSLKKLAQKAKEEGCEIALYGHTHEANIELIDGVLCINPGSLASYHSPSYCYLILHEKTAHVTILNAVTREQIASETIHL